MDKLRDKWMEGRKEKGGRDREKEKQREGGRNKTEGKWGEEVCSANYYCWTSALSRSISACGRSTFISCGQNGRSKTERESGREFEL